MVAERNTKLPKHPELESIPNLQVGFNLKCCRAAWQYRYYDHLFKNLDGDKLDFKIYWNVVPLSTINLVVYR
jgi:hypothetical protein